MRFAEETMMRLVAAEGDQRRNREPPVAKPGQLRRATTVLPQAERDHLLHHRKREEGII